MTYYTNNELAQKRQQKRELNLNQMIGRKISDQTITCKVIKPMQHTINNNSCLTVQKGDSPNKQTTKILNMKYEPIQQNMGRVFGTSNNEMQFEVDIGLNYENEFNRLNHYGKEQRDKNTVKNAKQTGRIDKDLLGKSDKDTKQLSSRNVTHFFINNKEKPINVEPIKKTNPSQKNITSLSQNEIKKSAQTPKTQDISFKTTIDNKSIQIEDKTAINNKSRLIDANNKRITQNIIKVSSNHQEKTASNHETKANNEKPSIQHTREKSNNQSHKQIPKMNKQLSNQQSKQRLSIVQNSSKITSSTSIHKHMKSPKNNKKSPKKNDQSQTKNDKSSLKNQKQRSANRKDNSLDKNETLKSLKSQLSKKQFDISFQPWGQISQEPSMCIQNYSPNKSNDLTSNHDEKRYDKKQKLTKINLNNHRKPQIKGQQQQKQYMKSQQQNEGQPIVNSANNKKQEVGKGNVMRAPFKKYMTVKEEIQEKLKEKKLKQLQSELKRKQIEEQKRLEEEKGKHAVQLAEMNSNNNEDVKDDEQYEQQEQERREIPQPILLPFVGPIKNLTIENILPKVKQDNPIPSDNHIDMPQITQITQIGMDKITQIQMDKITQIRMNNSQLIYNQIINLQQGQLSTYNQQNDQNKPYYNYVQSSDQQHQGQYEQQVNKRTQQQLGQLQQIKGTSEMVLFEFDQYHEQNTINLDRFKKFQEDLQQELNHKVNNDLEYLKHESNAQLFEDQQINLTSRQIYNYQPISVQKNFGEKIKIPQNNKNPQILQKKNPEIPRNDKNPQIALSNKTILVQKQPQQNSNKPAISNNRLSSKPLDKKRNQQQQSDKQDNKQYQSDEQEEQQTNPKLLQYLKNRNLISSNKPQNQSKPNANSLNRSNQPKTITKSTIPTSKQPKLKISQLLNHKTYNQPSSQVIIELDQEYLQSSIIANQSMTLKDTSYHHNNISISQKNKISPQKQQYPMNVEFYQPKIHEANEYQHKQIDICDSSSDQQEVHPYQPPKKPAFTISAMSPNQSSIDELFELNLESLLNKDFINLN